MNDVADLLPLNVTNDVNVNNSETWKTITIITDHRVRFIYSSFIHSFMDIT